ncbi:MAG: BatA domain-containing protein [Planctomycetota bacterium]|jgi:hypothetical protein
MTFDWPWALLTLPVIVTVAVWVLLRPRRPERIVGSNRLWRAVLAATGRRGRRRSITSTLAWLCVLAGCVLAGGALARPIWRAERPVRDVSIILAATAELGPNGPKTLSRAVSACLDRLDAADRVQLVLPNALGAADEWLSVADAQVELGKVALLPARWDELSFAPPAAESQMVIAFRPAGQADKLDSADTTVELPCELPPVTIEQFGARTLADGRVGVLVTIRNNTASDWSGIVRVGANDEPAGGMGIMTTMDVSSGETSTLTLQVPEEVFLTARLDSLQPDSLGTAAYLAYRPGARRTVAMTGKDDPMIRRFIDADPLLTLTGDAEQADVMVAVGVSASRGKPALVIHPPGAWPGTEMESVLLSTADVAADDEVMRGVDLSGVAVRRASGWYLDIIDGWVPLAIVDGQAVISRSATDLLSSPADARVSVAFDLSTENTNWTTMESFVIFMANAIRWLAPGDEDAGEYVATAPIVERFAEPGFYQDAEGAWRAVSLTGLRGGEPAAPVAEQIAGLDLPTPQSAHVDRALWSLLTAAALGLLLLGWLLYAREG